MSDNQRRLVARLAFLSLCVLPTSLVVYQLFHQRTTGDWQNLIQAKLGINVQIDSLETPVPGMTIFHGIRMLDAAGDIPAELNKVTLIAGDRRQLIVDQPVTLAPPVLANLVRQCNDQFTQIGFDNHPWQIIFDGGVTVVGDDDTSGFGVVLKPVQIDVQKQEGAVFTSVQMRIPSQESSESADPPNVLKFTIAQSLVGQGQNITIDTGTTGYLPCQFASTWIADVKHLGSESYFSGQINLHIDPNEWVDGHVQGMIGQIQLEDLVKPFGHRLDGLGHVTRLNCDIVQSRIEQMSGNIRSAYPGYVGTALLQAARQYLGIGTAEEFRNQVVAFGQFDFDWRIAGGQLSISKADDGIIALDSQGGNLAVCQNRQPIRLEQFAEFLVQPRGDSKLHDETMLLLGRFHYPSARTAELDIPAVGQPTEYR
jgi:hypothetical protein